MSLTFPNDLPTFISATIVILITITAALAPYLIARRLFVAGTDNQTIDLANSVLSRISALHSLILALVFAQGLLNHNSLRTAIGRESALVGDIFFDLARFGSDPATQARYDFVDYTRLVATEEWELLSREGELSLAAWDAWSNGYSKILDLEPEDSRQQALRDIMLRSVREISELRFKRLGAVASGLHSLFLFAAFAGVILVSIGYFYIPPTTVNISLFGIFGVYTGLVIYLILTYANPYTGAGAIAPDEFERMYTESMVSFHSAPK